MQSFQTLLDRLSQALAWIAGGLAIVMMLHVTADVIARTFFDMSLIGTIEIVSAYYMAGIAFLPLALITKERGHIIVELFTTWMSLPARTLLDAFVAVLSIGYVGLFVWQVTESAMRQTLIGEAREAGSGFIAVWPSRWVVPAGFSLTALYLVLHLWRDLQRIRRGRYEDDLEGSSSIGDEERL